MDTQTMRSGQIFSLTGLARYYGDYNNMCDSQDKKDGNLYGQTQHASWCAILPRSGNFPTSIVGRSFLIVSRSLPWQPCMPDYMPSRHCSLQMNQTQHSQRRPPRRSSLWCSKQVCEMAILSSRFKMMQSLMPVCSGHVFPSVNTACFSLQSH